MSEKRDTRVSRRHFLRMAGGLAAGALAASCAPKTVIVEKEKVVTQVVKETVKETVVVEGTPKVVEKEVTKVVEKVVTPTPTPVPVRTEPVEITLGVHWGGATLDALQKLIDAYNEGQGTDDMVQVTIEVGAHDEKVITAKRLAGQFGDVYHQSGDRLVSLGAGGILAPLPDEEVQFVRDAYWPAAGDAHFLGGKCYGYPTEFQTTALMYRKSWFAEAGLEPPKDTVEVREAAKKLTDKEADPPRYGFITGWDSSWQIGSDIRSVVQRHGGDIYKWEGEVPVVIDVDTPEMRAAINYWLDMTKDGSTNVGEVGFDEALQNGFGAMGEREGWFPIIMLRDAGRQDLFEDTGIVRTPAAPGVEPVVRSYTWGLTADIKSPHLEACFQFMKAMMHPPDMPFSRFIVDHIGAVPAYKEYPLETITGWSEDMIEGYIRQSAPYAVQDLTRKTMSYAEIRSKIQAAIQGILIGELEMDAALAELQKTVQAIFDKYEGRL